MPAVKKGTEHIGVIQEVDKTANTVKIEGYKFVITGDAAQYTKYRKVGERVVFSLKDGMNGKKVITFIRAAKADDKPQAATSENPAAEPADAQPDPEKMKQAGFGEPTQGPAPEEVKPDTTIHPQDQNGLTYFEGKMMTRDEIAEIKSKRAIEAGRNPHPGPSGATSRTDQPPAPAPVNEGSVLASGPVHEVSTNGTGGAAKTVVLEHGQVTVGVTVNLEHYENLKMEVTLPIADLGKVRAFLDQELGEYGRSHPETAELIDRYRARVLRGASS